MPTRSTVFILLERTLRPREAAPGNRSVAKLGVRFTSQGSFPLLNLKASVLHPAPLSQAPKIQSSEQTTPLPLPSGR